MVTGGAAKKKSGNRTSIKDFFGKFGKCVSTSVSARTRNPSQKQGGALNKRLVGPTDGRTYERISRDSLNYYYGGTQYHNAAVVMDMIMNCPYMDGYKMPGDWFDKNLVNIVFYSKNVDGQLYFASHVASELAKTRKSSWADVLKMELKIADAYLTDDPDLDYIFGRLAVLVRLTYSSSRTTPFCRVKHWEAWPEQPANVQRAYAALERALTTTTSSHPIRP